MKHLVKTLIILHGTGATVSCSLLPDNGPYPEERRAIFYTNSSLKKVFNIILSPTKWPVSDGFLTRTVYAHRDTPNTVPV